MTKDLRERKQQQQQQQQRPALAAEEEKLQLRVDALVTDSEAVVSGRDAGAILADTAVLEKEIKESSISDAAKKRMLESLKDVNSGLALEKYSGKILQVGLVVVMVVPMLASILEGCFEFLTRPTISPELVDLAGMVAVVTGGCGAVGIELAILLAGSGANVILGCRGAGTESTAVATASYCPRLAAEDRSARARSAAAGRGAGLGCGPV